MSNYMLETSGFTRYKVDKNEYIG
ncbi:hypothetical protein EYZ11_001741 [Aspergillus tanneri]|uniref:Uncharacterized protein n=1 Tax=Aspergillus tanneri TaxID=1220188 RepID=A0A4S3JSK9_9EURO|nr:hypothetical protein EYZ11_001741 [Aspergillus tanneri]